MIRNKNASVFFQIREKKEDGFTLVEVIIALVILMISVMGIFAVFTYATVYNTGNSMRSQALSTLQKEVEMIRSAKFTPTITDNYTPGTSDDGRRDLRAEPKRLEPPPPSTELLIRFKRLWTMTLLPRAFKPKPTCRIRN